MYTMYIDDTCMILILYACIKKPSRKVIDMGLNWDTYGFLVRRVMCEKTKRSQKHKWVATATSRISRKGEIQLMSRRNNTYSRPIINHMPGFCYPLVNQDNALGTSILES